VGGFNRGNFFSALAGLIVGAMLIAALPGSAQAGDPMLIGRRNHSLPTTSLVAAGGLRVKVGQGTNPALQLEVQAGVAPIQVDSTALVANLNADLHDGMEASDFATSGHAHNSTGGDLSHDNMHPYETIQCIIALSGVYPSRNDGPLTTGSGRVLDPWVGEIAWFAGGFAPRGWAFCDGQLLPIAQYQSLFSILGTTYGGDGRTTFGLRRQWPRPDLAQLGIRGRVGDHDSHGGTTGCPHPPVGLRLDWSVTAAGVVRPWPGPSGSATHTSVVLHPLGHPVTAERRIQGTHHRSLRGPAKPSKLVAACPSVHECS